MLGGTRVSHPRGRDLSLLGHRRFHGLCEVEHPPSGTEREKGVSGTREAGRQAGSQTDRQTDSRTKWGGFEKSCDKVLFREDESIVPLTGPGILRGAPENTPFVMPAYCETCFLPQACVPLRSPLLSSPLLVGINSVMSDCPVAVNT